MGELTLSRTPSGIKKSESRYWMTVMSGMHNSLDELLRATKEHSRYFEISEAALSVLDQNAIVLSANMKILNLAIVSPRQLGIIGVECYHNIKCRGIAAGFLPGSNELPFLICRQYQLQSIAHDLTISTEQTFAGVKNKPHLFTVYRDEHKIRLDAREVPPSMRIFSPDTPLVWVKPQR